LTCRSGGLAARLLDAISPDIVDAELIKRHGAAEAATSAQVEAVQADLKDDLRCARIQTGRITRR